MKDTLGLSDCCEEQILSTNEGYICSKCKKLTSNLKGITKQNKDVVYDYKSEIESFPFIYFCN